MQLSSNSPISRLLEASPKAVLTLYASIAAFSTYFCMYAFRRPFSVATFDEIAFLGSPIGLKTAVVLSQLIGYAISKFLSVKFCSEITWERRSRAILGLIGIAWLALLVYGPLPGPVKVAAIFVNGLCLGMIWGLVTGYLEGRTTSEILLAALSCSFIIGSGMTKDVGKWLMANQGTSESWVGFVTGAVFVLPLILAVYLLNQIPRPTMDDEAQRVHRQPMNRAERWRFIKTFLPGMVMLMAVYFLLTAYRDYWDSFGEELFKDLGYSDTPGIFTKTSMPIAFGVMVCMAALAFFKDNRWGLAGVFVIMTSGILMVVGATLAFQAGMLGGVPWMILIGLGAYLAYVPFGSVLFDRIIAETGTVATAVFAISLADALGYTGVVSVYLYKEFFAGDASRLNFFIGLTYLMAAVGAVCLIGSCIYFLRHAADRREVTGATPAQD